MSESDMETQSLNLAEKLIQTRIRKAKKEGYKGISINSVFHMLRNNDAFSFYGDYPLLAIGCEMIQSAGFPIARDAIFRVFRESDEFALVRQRDRIALVDQLQKTSQEASEEISSLERSVETAVNGDSAMVVHLNQKGGL